MDNNCATDVFQICRTCMNEITSALPFFYLDYTPAGNAQLTIRQKLYNCIPELDLNMLPNAVICGKCTDTIMSFYEFKEKCLQSEVQIRKYTQQIQHTGDLNLVEVVQFDQPYNNNLDIKVEMEDIDITEDLICDTSAFNEIGERTESMDSKYLLLEKINMQSVLFNTDDAYDISYSLSPPEENSEIYNSNIAENCLSKVEPKVMEYQDNYSQNLNKMSAYYQCYRCGHQAKSKLKLISHLKHHTSKHCYQEIKLKQHMPIHTAQKPFSCSICDYHCKQKSNLKQHVRIHTGEKPFSCSVCEYRGTQKSHLDQHMRIHTGEKPFVCSICNYKFIQKSHLDRHMRNHIGEWQFSCSLCEYQCNKISQLKQHIRIHTPEKPFSCSVCEYKCNVKGNLKQHMRIHTGEKPFVCSICNYKFIQKSHLNKHIMRNHTGESHSHVLSVNTYQCNKKSQLKQP